MNAQDRLNLWGCKKYNYPLGTEFKLQLDTGDDGYCETCSSPYPYISVQVAEGKKRNFKEIAEIRDMELHILVNEVLTVCKDYGIG